MSDNSVLYSEAIAYIFSDDSLPRIDDELRSMGGTVAEDPCRECNGTMYELDHEVVCGRCSTVRDGSRHTESGSNKWKSFAENRPTYQNSHMRRCVGGFPHVHDWVTTDEIDGAVVELDPVEFYR